MPKLQDTLDVSYFINSQGGLFRMITQGTEQGQTERVTSLKNEMVTNIFVNGKAKNAFTGTSFFAQTASGKLYGWGDNKKGELGLGHCDKVLEPVALAVSEKGVRSFSTALDTACAVCNDNKVYIWGITSIIPQRIQALEDKHIQHVALSNETYQYTLYAINENGELYKHLYYQQNSTTPSLQQISVPDNKKIKGIYFTPFDVYLLAEDKMLYKANCTRSTSSFNFKLVLTEVVTFIATPNINYFALKSDGSLYAWSECYYSQDFEKCLGRSVLDSKQWKTPERVTFFDQVCEGNTQLKIKQLIAGNYNILIELDNGWQYIHDEKNGFQLIADSPYRMVFNNGYTPLSKITNFKDCTFFYQDKTAVTQVTDLKSATSLINNK